MTYEEVVKEAQKIVAKGDASGIKDHLAYGMDSNLFVSKYQLYLPNEEDLKQLINRIIEEGGNEQEE